MTKTVTQFAALATLTVLGGGVLAQAPPPSPPVHHGIFGRMFHPKSKTPPIAAGSFGRAGTAGRPGLGGTSGLQGGFIGNKNSHVYHLPGDRGAMPSPQNRVYFRSAAAAEAAGYHLAGSAAHAMKRPVMHGSPMNGTPGGMPHRMR